MAIALAAKSNVPDAVVQKHIRIISAAKEELDAANGEYRAKLKAAKSDGINQKQLLAALLAKRRDEDRVQADLRDYIRYCGLAMVSLKQADLFEETSKGAAPEDQDDVNEHRAWEVGEAGKQAGAAGRSRDDNPYDAGTESFVVWDAAYLDGQEKIANELGPKTKVASTRRKRGRPPANGIHAVQ
jgi:ribosome modulation factor